MKIWRGFEEIPSSPPLFAATIGNFDGLHLGHMSLLKSLKQAASEKGEKSLVITYANSPLSVLKPDIPEKLLITLDQKIHLLSEFHIDYLLLLTFTKSFSEQPYDLFLSHLLEKLPIRQFVFGYDTTLGKDKTGNKTAILEFCEKNKTPARYIEPFLIDGEIISSRKIRSYLEIGDLANVMKGLGRPFTILNIITKGAGRGRTIGFPTANLNVGNLCTPPFGVYAVLVNLNGVKYHAIANLGVRPTFDVQPKPTLEVHLFEYHGPSLEGKKMEVEFLHFIRPEKKFSGADELVAQIKKDIAEAKSIVCK